MSECLYGRVGGAPALPGPTGEVTTTRARRRTFPGRPDQIAQARRFAQRALEGCPVADEVILCVSELATNALLHTASGNGGKFTVILKRGKSWVWVAVCDDGSDKSPIVRALDAASEDGRGLGLVALIADRWGELSDKHGRAVWIELRWDTGLATRRYSERPERGSVPS